MTSVENTYNVLVEYMCIINPLNQKTDSIFTMRYGRFCLDLHQYLNECHDPDSLTVAAIAYRYGLTLEYPKVPMWTRFIRQVCIEIKEAGK